MKKFKYFLWSDPNLGYGVGETICYINANNEEHAKSRLIKEKNFKHDPDFISGDIQEVKEFIQPRRIPII